MSRSYKGNSRLYVQAIFALAAALALSTSACNKKNDGPAVASPAAVGATGGEPVVDTTTVGTVTGNTTAAGASAPGALAGAATTGEGKLGSNEVIVETSGQPRASESVAYIDPTGLTRDQVYARKTKVDLAGAFLGESVRSDITSIDGKPLFYSGSGQDSLRTHLYALVNERAAKLDAETRALDKKLAQSIQLASFEIKMLQRGQGHAVLKFRLERPDRDGKPYIHAVSISGPIDNLELFTIYDEATDATVRAEVACMDIAGGCNTVHIRVEDLKMGGTAHLIARHTATRLDIGGSKAIGSSGNPEYDRLLSVFVNTAHAPSGPNVVEQWTLTTSETIGGASNFAVNMKIRLQDQWGRKGGDTIEITGPLAKSVGSDSLDIAANITPAYTIIENKIVPSSATGTQKRFVEVINEARLLRNNGRGGLQIELDVSDSAGGTREQIFLMFSRIHTPTRAVHLKMQ